MNEGIDKIPGGRLGLDEVAALVYIPVFHTAVIGVDIRIPHTMKNGGAGTVDTAAAIPVNHHVASDDTVHHKDKDEKYHKRLSDGMLDGRAECKNGKEGYGSCQRSSCNKVRDEDGVESGMLDTTFRILPQVDYLIRHVDGLALRGGAGNSGHSRSPGCKRAYRKGSKRLSIISWAGVFV